MMAFDAALRLKMSSYTARSLASPEMPAPAYLTYHTARTPLTLPQQRKLDCCLMLPAVDDEGSCRIVNLDYVGGEGCIRCRRIRSIIGLTHPTGSMRE